LSGQDPGKNIIEYLTGSKGPYDFSLVGEYAYNLYRIEKGFPTAKGELKDKYNPHDVGLLNYVDFNKGCYIGQEVIARLDTYQKVQRFLKGIMINSELKDDLPIIMYDDSGNESGEITSLSYCEKEKKSFGLGFVKKAFADYKELTIKSDKGQKLLVTISKLPFKK